jgi:predicted RNase H-like nuclease
VKYLGIDGCRGGWFYVWLHTEDSHGFGILKTIDALTGLVDNTDAFVLIDMPIGLSETGPHERQCDKAARKLLKKRGSSIFPAPCRQSLQAHDYLTASDINHKVTGRRLSRQTYHLMPKIWELDGFIRGSGRGLEIREFHPELGFLALNRFVPLTFSKKNVSGQRERLEILSRYAPCSPAILSEAAKRFPRNQAGVDDILDALCGAVAASFKDHLVSLPAVPETDPRGLPMQIVYADPDKAAPVR